MTQVGIAGRSDPYEFWHLALSGVPVGSDELPVYADRPQCGFYRMRRGIRAPWEAIAIFHRDDALVALVDGRETPPNSIWHWCCVHPISEMAYHHARETGQWGDLDDTVLVLQNQDAVPERFKNSAPYERLKQQIDLAIGSASLYETIADDTTSLKAQSLRAKLIELANAADKLRETEKRPHFQQAKLIDSVWMPTIKAGQEAAVKIRKALSRYETLKAAKAMLERRNEPLPERIESGYGRAASIRDKTVIASVEDWAALFAYYANDQRARDMILKLAERDAASGVAVPGITTKTEKEVR
jgi:hypothetical protein